MKILLAHGRYQGQTSGENTVFEQEAALLKKYGHEVFTYERSNHEFDYATRWDKLLMGPQTVWQRKAYKDILNLVRIHTPDIVHFHNTLPLISPSAYYAVKKRGSRVIQTLHNYRFVCPNALFLRNGQPCEACLGKRLAWPGIRHACYRKSRMATTAVVAMLSAHRLLGTYDHMIDRYIVLTEFAREKFIAGGLPAQKLAVKPNFIAHDPGFGQGKGGYALYVGRLSHEKGIQVALDAWNQHHLPFPLHIIGDGAYRAKVEAAAQENEHVIYHGTRPHDYVLHMMQDAQSLILPSICYEGFPMTLAESYACGLPVIASRIGALAHLVQESTTGVHFDAGNAQDLASSVTRLFVNQDILAAMRQSTRRFYEEQYTPHANHKQLLHIYQAAMQGGN